MIKKIGIGILLSTLCPGAFASSFLVELTNQSIKVSSPKKEMDPVSVVIKNSTSIKIHSELRSADKVLSRFVVGPNSAKTLQLKLPHQKKFYYVTKSPPSQAVELKFNQRDYEIPEKE